MGEYKALHPALDTTRELKLIEVCFVCEKEETLFKYTIYNCFRRTCWRLSTKMTKTSLLNLYVIITFICVTVYSFIRHLPPSQIQDYDAISRIDNWLTAQLLHIKNSIDANPDVN